MLRNFAIIFLLAYRNVFSNWAKNKVIIYIISFSFILIQLLLALAVGFGIQIKNSALDGLLGHMKITTPAYKIDPDIKNNFYISPQIIEAMAKIDGVKGVTTRIQVPLVLKSERKIKNAVLVGIDTVREKDLSFIGKSYGYNNFDEHFKDNSVLLGAKNLKKLETKLMYKIVGSTQDAKGNKAEIAYFVNDTYKSSLPKVEEIYLFSDIKTIANIYKLGNRVTEVSIVLTDEKYTDTVTREVLKLVPTNAHLYQWGELMPFLKDWLDMMAINMLVFFAVVFFAAAIPIGNTLLMSVLERVHEFGIMQALGLKKPYLSLLIMSEAFIILCVGLVMGLVISITLTFIVQYTGIDISKFAKGAEEFGFGDHIYPKFDFIYTLIMSLAMLVIGMLSSIYPAIKASLYNPVQALSKRG